jgi:hypothetical protein
MSYFFWIVCGPASLVLYPTCHSRFTHVRDFEQVIELFLLRRPCARLCQAIGVPFDGLQDGPLLVYIDLAPHVSYQGRCRFVYVLNAVV